MNGESNQQVESVNYPDLSSSNTDPPPPPQAPPTSSSVYGQETKADAPSSSTAPPPNNENAEKWGTHVMGTPAVPTCHPNNQKAALWGAGAADQKDYQNHHQPYVQYTPINTSSSAPFDSVLQKFNSWSAKAESTAHNIWHNRMSLSVCVSVLTLSA